MITRPRRRRHPAGRVDVPPPVSSAVLRIPEITRGPVRAIVRRVLMAFSALLLTATVVYFGRSGYTDTGDAPLSFLDCFYYATASLSTTGYGDIHPISPGARLTNILVITPLRFVFLVLLVGSTLAALTETSRQVNRIRRWRRRTSGHTVVVGYGTKGRAAAKAVLFDNDTTSVAVVDTDRGALDAAWAREMTTISGSGTRRDVLGAAAVSRAGSIIVSVDRDDTAVLVTLTARQLAPTARIVVAVRASSSVHLLRQCGADTVVVSQETAGRLLGVATSAPSVVDAVADLLSRDRGLAITERVIEPDEEGRAPQACDERVLGVVRDGVLHRTGSAVETVKRGDRLLYVRSGPD
ncbi:MAG: potassium channel family protein [Rhodococcus sp. (in: high G+C Gram-positive bacteria)]